MLEYQDRPCPHCSEYTLVYHQYIGDSHCESCGEWETEEEESE